MFSYIGDVQLLPDGALVVAEQDAQEIRVFDAGGAFVRSFGRKGQGPGEFEYLRKLAVRGDHILAWDSAQRLSTFTLAGELVSTVRTNNIGENPNTATEGFFGDGSMLVALGELIPPTTGDVFEVRATLVRWDPDAPEDLVTFATIDSGRFQVDEQTGSSWSIPFVPRTEPVAADAAVYVSPTGAFEVQRYRLDGSLERIVRVNEQAAPVNAEFLAEYIQERIDAAAEERREELRARYEAMPFPEHFPIIDALYVDDGQNVWVRRYRADPADQQQILHVFDADGLLAGTIHLPANLEFRLATRDRFIGLWRDELDVQSVRIYALERQ